MGATLRSRITVFLPIVFGICFLIPLTPQPSLAQITFERIYGGDSTDQGYCVQQTQDGGYIIAGGTYSFGTSACDVYLVKTDSLGDTLWTATYGGDYYELAHCVQQTSDLGYILVGDLVYSKPMDIYLVKTDSLGIGLWDTTYYGELEDEERGRWVQQTTDGGYIIVGEIEPFVGERDVYLMKTDSFGDTLWTRKIGGTGVDRGNSVEQTLDEGYIIVGTTSSFGADSGDIYLIKTDSQGDTIWTRTHGGSNADWGSSVQQTSDGGYIIAGGTCSFGQGGSDVYIIKTDSVGDSVWTRAYGGTLNDWGWSVDQTTDGGYVVTGGTYSFGGGQDVYLIKTDSVGDTLWTRIYGGSQDDWGNSVVQALDGGYVIAGWSESFGTGYRDDVYLIKTDSLGRVLGIQEQDRKSKIENKESLQNQPNPFHKSTLISYSLPAATCVTIEVYDITGRLVEIVVNETQKSGIHRVRWDPKSQPSGIYFYRLKAGEFVETRKMVVVD